MIHSSNQTANPKGWFVGPWNSAVPIPVGYANEGINERHYHAKMFEIYLVAKGTSMAIIDETEVPLQAGDMLVVEPGEVHTFIKSSHDYLHFVIQTPFVKSDKTVMEWPEQAAHLSVMFKKDSAALVTTIRPIEQQDWPATWSIIEPVFRSGETYSFDPDISEEDAYRAWVTLPTATFIAEGDGHIVGAYYLKPNQPGLGAHVCNCGYIVGEKARGRGVASAICRHSQNEAARRGFRAMQFNLVVSTNEGAIRLWKKHGFDIVGALPGAFLHPTKGYVDAFVMYKQLRRRAA